MAEIASDMARKWKASQMKYQVNKKNKLQQQMYVAGTVSAKETEDTQEKIYSSRYNQ